jgi:hypothetical protein
MTQMRRVLTTAILDALTAFATMVTAFEPLVVTSPLSSAAVMAEAEPRTNPVSVLPVPVPPLGTGITEKLVAGADPAPPPRTNCPAPSAAEDTQVVAPEKYGIPPLVPATLKAGVVVGLETETSPPVKDALVTVPDPAPSLPFCATAAKYVPFAGRLPVDARMQT